MVKRIYDKVKSVIFADPEQLYQKEKNLSRRPFYFPGQNGKAVLLIHGWTSVPYEVRRLGEYLNENGYTVSGPLLRGHGTVPNDLEKIQWTDWLFDIEKEFEKLAKEHQKIYLIGTSLGASLSILLAQKKANVSGLVLMATPYKIRLEKIATFIAKSSLFLGKKYNRKFYPPTFGSSDTITRLVSYQTYPIGSALEVPKLGKAVRENLGKISQPCFLLQSTSDHIVSRKSLEKIYTRINSKIKKKKYIKRAYHTFISDIRNENVFQDILEFLEEN